MHPTKLPKSVARSQRAIDKEPYRCIYPHTSAAIKLVLVIVSLIYAVYLVFTGIHGKRRFNSYFEFKKGGFISFNFNDSIINSSYSFPLIYRNYFLATNATNLQSREHDAANYINSEYQKAQTLTNKILINKQTSHNANSADSSFKSNLRGEKGTKEQDVNVTYSINSSSILAIGAIQNHNLQKQKFTKFTDGRIFLARALQFIKDGSDIVYFNGPRVKRIFDSDNSNPHLLSTEKLKLRSWLDLVSHLKDIKVLRPNTLSVHLHNELKLGDFLLLILQDYKRLKQIKFPASFEPIPIDPIGWYKVMNHEDLPNFVMTNTADENWGFLSTAIGTRTTHWINMTNHLRLHYSSYDTMQLFLNSEKLVLLVCNTHVDPRIGYHDKIITLPLGIKSRDYSLAKAQAFLKTNYTKSILLTINNSGWGDRKEINEMVSKAFNRTVANTYKKKFIDKNGESLDHLEQVARSKFVLCPSGLGFDTYRLWETLLMGSIPVVESNEGLNRMYSRLPVLVVRHYSDLTPSMLVNIYPCFVKHVDDFRYNHLREDYWLKLVGDAIASGNILALLDNHPSRNPHCSVL